MMDAEAAVFGIYTFFTIRAASLLFDRPSNQGNNSYRDPDSEPFFYYFLISILFIIIFFGINALIGFPQKTSILVLWLAIILLCNALTATPTDTTRAYCVAVALEAILFQHIKPIVDDHVLLALFLLVNSVVSFLIVKLWKRAFKKI